MKSNPFNTQDTQFTASHINIVLKGKHEEKQDNAKRVVIKSSPEFQHCTAHSLSVSLRYMVIKV